MAKCRLNVECENKDVIKSLVDETHGIKGLDKAYLSKKSAKSCLLELNGNTDWDDALRHISRKYNTTINCWISLEDDAHSILYNFEFLKGVPQLMDVDFIYRWEEGFECKPYFHETNEFYGRLKSKNGNYLYERKPKQILNADQKKEVEDWARHVDRLGSQKVECLLTGTKDVFKFNPNVHREIFDFNDYRVIIQKEAHLLSVLCVIPLVSIEDCPFR